MITETPMPCYSPDLRRLLGDTLDLIHKHPCSHGDIHRGLMAWYELFLEITGVDAYDFNGTPDLTLPGGKALGVSGAAFCLLESKRTAVFLRGLEWAIRDLQKRQPDERIKILYAGCGPFASLVVPLSARFGPDEIGWHLIEINPASLRAAELLHEALQLQPYLLGTDCTDAAKFVLPFESRFHVILSETMQRALQNETQLAIELNLLPQMQPGTLFLPEEITVSAEFRRSECASISDPLGLIYRVGQHHHSPPEPVSVTLPHDASTGQLYLTTEVQVYGNERLTGNDTSITLPQPVAVPADAGREVELEYRWNPAPGFAACTATCTTR